MGAGLGIGQYEGMNFAGAGGAGMTNGAANMPNGHPNGAGLPNGTPGLQNGTPGLPNQPSGELIDIGLATGTRMDQSWFSFVGQSGLWEATGRGSFAQPRPIRSRLVSCHYET